ncbi:sensor histidine kinase [Marinomonas sp. MED121]|nr:sensor histidine kinase [Marinomonas sp. MED121]
MDNWTPFMQKIEHHRGGGVIRMLADEMNAIDQSEQAQLLETLQQDFGYVIALKSKQQINLSVQERIKIELGEIVFDRSSLQLMTLLKDGQTLIVIENMEQSAAHIINPISMNITSCINLVKLLLAELDESQWQSLVDIIASMDAVPFAITANHQLPLNAEQKATLVEMGDLYIETKESLSQLIPGEIIYSRISNSDKSIVIGPITPAINDMVNKIQLAFYLLFTLSLLLPLIIWIMPTWMSARALRRSSKHFAFESMSERVKYIFASNLNGVAKTFNKMADRLEYLLNRNSLLAGAISHDLRTPIAAMEFSLEMLISHDDETRRKRYLIQMRTHLAVLIKMHKELQIYTEFERREIELQMQTERLDLWLDQHLKRYWEDKSLSVSIIENAQESVCKLDSTYLGRALDNLINNGLYYAKSLLHISLRVEAGQCIICVENDGEPIMEGSREDIFEPFVRLNQGQTKEQDSSGLGLAIVRQIMSWHKGAVNVETSELGGAKFILSLPRLENKRSEIR